MADEDQLSSGDKGADEERVADDKDKSKEEIKNEDGYNGEKKSREEDTSPRQQDNSESETGGHLDDLESAEGDNPPGNQKDLLEGTLDAAEFEPVPSENDVADKEANMEPCTTANDYFLQPSEQCDICSLTEQVTENKIEMKRNGDLEDLRDLQDGTYCFETTQDKDVDHADSSENKERENAERDEETEKEPSIDDGLADNEENDDVHVKEDHSNSNDNEYTEVSDETIVTSHAEAADLQNRHILNHNDTSKKEEQEAEDDTMITSVAHCETADLILSTNEAKGLTVYGNEEPEVNDDTMTISESHREASDLQGDERFQISTNEDNEKKALEVSEDMTTVIESYPVSADNHEEHILNFNTDGNEKPEINVDDVIASESYHEAEISRVPDENEKPETNDDMMIACEVAVREDTGDNEKPETDDDMMTKYPKVADSQDQSSLKVNNAENDNRIMDNTITASESQSVNTAENEIRLMDNAITASESQIINTTENEKQEVSEHMPASSEIQPEAKDFQDKHSLDSSSEEDIENNESVVNDDAGTKSVSPHADVDLEDKHSLNRNSNENDEMDVDAVSVTPPRSQSMEPEMCSDKETGERDVRGVSTETMNDNSKDPTDVFHNFDNISPGALVTEGPANDLSAGGINVGRNESDKADEVTPSRIQEQQAACDIDENRDLVKKQSESEENSDLPVQSFHTEDTLGNSDIDTKNGCHRSGDSSEDNLSSLEVNDRENLRDGLNLYTTETCESGSEDVLPENNEVSTSENKEMYTSENNEMYNEVYTSEKHSVERTSIIDGEKSNMLASHTTEDSRLVKSTEASVNEDVTNDPTLRHSTTSIKEDGNDIMLPDTMTDIPTQQSPEQVDMICEGYQENDMSTNDLEADNQDNTSEPHSEAAKVESDVREGTPLESKTNSPSFRECHLLKEPTLPLEDTIQSPTGTEDHLEEAVADDTLYPLSSTPKDLNAGISDVVTKGEIQTVLIYPDASEVNEKSVYGDQGLLNGSRESGALTEEDPGAILTNDLIDDLQTNAGDPRESYDSAMRNSSEYIQEGHEQVASRAGSSLAMNDLLHSDQVPADAETTEGETVNKTLTENEPQGKQDKKRNQKLGESATQAPSKTSDLTSKPSNTLGGKYGSKPTGTRKLTRARCLPIMAWRAPPSCREGGPKKEDNGDAQKDYPGGQLDSGQDNSTSPSTKPKRHRVSDANSRHHLKSQHPNQSEDHPESHATSTHTYVEASSRPGIQRPRNALSPSAHRRQRSTDDTQFHSKSARDVPPSRPRGGVVQTRPHTRHLPLTTSTGSSRQSENGKGDNKKGLSPRGNSRSPRGKSEASDGRSQQKEFFKEELKRLENSLARESSKIVPPPRKKYSPFIFNTLEPYYNTHTTRFLIELPEEQCTSYSYRNTAKGLCDPWVDLQMDREILPQISFKSTVKSDPGKHKKESSKSMKNKEARPEKKGSTRLPKFPVVTLETKELATRKLFYSDVPMLRQELKDKYSSQAKEKVDADYKRTQQDFYRMELDRIDQVSPKIRPQLISTYMAYLQNTPGSRRAIHDCVRNLKVEEKAN